MRPRLWSRTLAGFLALWFPLIAGEPGILRACPAHGAATAAEGMHHGESAVADHAMSHASHAGATDAGTTHHSVPGHDHHNCTCINCCTVSVTALHAPDVSGIEAGVVQYRTVRTVPNAESLARPAPEYSRPYTTGPPRA